ncbi:XRE family transcriptional regulator [Sphingomonas morindae]|uniref:XRE family transcriptional regulator n=1 Tax=Sphingomonas morindae TaxID=1541170 RepID=A0ABY4XDR9_9SPHN|nr:XRE family transcriptional regulator [Sphingomonas morindae]USI75121.1 XRE family transcriptional regulator [Sphingomonas morindae]
MSSLARIEEDACCSSGGIERRDVVPLIHQAMSEKNIGQRKLALKTGISKTRIGLLLHSDPAKRTPIYLREFFDILGALDINVVQAVIALETYRDPKLFHDERFQTSIAMLTELFKGLPGMLVDALDEIEGMDGTEIRKEWAGPLRQAVIEKLVKEVGAVMARRASLTQTSFLGI